MNEHTSKRVARIAGMILRLKPWTDAATCCITVANRTNSRWIDKRIPWSDIRALAASALTQAEDHAHRETLRKGKLPRGHKLIKRHKPVARNGKAREHSEKRGKR